MQFLFTSTIYTFIKKKNERERGQKKYNGSAYTYVCMCLWACMYTWENEKKERKGGQMTRMSVSDGQKAIIDFSW